MVFSVPHADNLFHFLNDGFMPVITTLTSLRATPTHVQRCPPPPPRTLVSHACPESEDVLLHSR